MTRREAAEWLKKDSCSDCSIGCYRMTECKEDSCELKAAVGMIAVAICTGGIEVNDDSSMGNVSNYTGSSLDVLDLDKD